MQAPEAIVPKRAIVLLSGGQDSTLALYWALHQFDWSREEVLTLSFDYGQRHDRELESGRQIAEFAKVDRVVLDLKHLFPQLGPSALTGGKEVGDPQHHNLPASFVPGRNIFFLTAAAAYGYHRNIRNFVVGVSELDYSGYPDCRANTLDALQNALQYGLDTQVRIHRPWLHLSKAEALRMAREHFPEALKALKFSHTCYRGASPPCGTCDACLIRARSFEEARIPDPLLVTDG